MGNTGFHLGGGGGAFIKSVTAIQRYARGKCRSVGVLNIDLFRSFEGVRAKS